MRPIKYFKQKIKEWQCSHHWHTIQSYKVRNKKPYCNMAEEKDFYRLQTCNYIHLKHKRQCCLCEIISITNETIFLRKYHLEFPDWNK